MKTLGVALVLTLAALGRFTPLGALGAQQVADMAFRPTVETPAYRAEGLDRPVRVQRRRDRGGAELGRRRRVAAVDCRLSFFLNSSHNILKGTVVDALLRGERWNLTFNDLLSGGSR